MQNLDDIHIVLSAIMSKGYVVMLVDYYDIMQNVTYSWWRNIYFWLPFFALIQMHHN